MKKRIVAITLSLLTLLTMLSGCFDNCFTYEPSTSEDRIILYDIDFSFDLDGEYATACSTTKKGRTEKETVIVPETIEIEGKGTRIVNQLGIEGLFGFTMCKNFKSDVLKKIFIPRTITEDFVHFQTCENLKYIVYDLDPNNPAAYRLLKSSAKYYTGISETGDSYLNDFNINCVLISEETKKIIKESIISSNYITLMKKFKALNLAERYLKSANVEYHLNYKAEKELFWFDYSETGKVEKSYEPVYEPKREGYEFAGWYKEPECINEWNFETDSFADKTDPEMITKDYDLEEIAKLSDEEIEKLFIETKAKVLERYESLYTLKLYAKWNLI